MDWTEWEGDDAMSARIYWWEMSAVWMEEMMYDDVNDYYGYLPAFFNLPWIGLRNFSASSYTLALHPYGSVVFPIFLTERWGDTTIVRKIWENCRDYGIGPQFGEAADDAIFEVSGGTHHLVDAMREFAVWNMFTGSRAVRAPDGIGYSESSNYPLIPDSSMFSFDAYPLQVKSLRDSIIYSAKRPEVFGTNYLKFDNLFLIPDSFSLYFYRPLMYKDLDWNVSLIGLPINDAAKAIVQMDLYDAPLYERYVLQNSEDLFKVFTLVTPVTTLITEDNYQDRYDYAFIVLDSSDTIPSPIPYNFKAPYPNPCTACDSITFKVEKSPMDNGPLELEVIIFNSAGEKIIELSTDTFGAGEIAIAWDIKNESGYPVSSGVYLVYCRLSFPGIEDMPEVIHKSKLAILK